MSYPEQKIQAPYLGLRPFEESDHPIFFGREDQVISMLGILATRRFLAVVGSSGSGKSSLVRAGLIPGVRRGFLAGTKDWLVVPPVKPGNAPYANLASALVECLPAMAGATDKAVPDADVQDSWVDAFKERLRESDRGLLKVLEGGGISSSTKVLLVIDQFEEIFAFRSPRPGKAGYASRDDAAAFVSMLQRTCQENDGRFWVVLTMRSDFIGQCEAFLGLPEKVSSCQFLVPRLTRRQMTEAIVNPSRVTGVAYLPFDFEDGLVNQIINDAGDQPDQLPLMQHVLMRTWKLSASSEESPGGKKLLSFHSYQEKAGGLQDALNRDANHAWREVVQMAADSVGQKAAMPEITRQMFLLLCEESLDGQMIRHRPLVKDVLAVTGASLGALKEILRLLQKGDRNLVLPSLDDRCLLETDVMDISHEALLRQWKKYQDWQGEEKKNVAELRDLCRRVQLFKKNSSRVLSQEDLTAFKKWKAARTTPWALRYVKEEEWQAIDELFKGSEKSLWLARNTTRFLKLLAITSMAGGGLVALLAGGLAVQKSSEVERAVKTTRATLSLQQHIGNSSDKFSRDETAALWRIAELSSEHAVVRQELLNYWTEGSGEIARGAKRGGDGIGAAMGLSLSMRQYVSKRALLLVEKIVEQRPSEFVDSELTWQFLGQFEEPAQLAGCLVKLLEITEHNDSDHLSRLASSLVDLAGKLDAATAAPFLQRGTERLVKALVNPQETDLDRLSRLAWSLVDLAGKLDAAAAAPLLQEASERLVKALENLPESDPDHLSSLVSSLAALAGKLDVAAAAPLLQEASERLVKALENSQESNPDRLYRLPEALATLAGKLDAAAVIPLAERLVRVMEDPQGTSTWRLFSLAESLAALAGKLDTSVAASLAYRVAEVMENTQETDASRLFSLAQSLASLAAKLDAAVAAPLLQRGAERLVKALENTHEIASSRLYRLTESLAALAGKLDAVTAAPLLQKGAERLAKSLDNAQETNVYSLSRLVSSLADLADLAGKFDASAAAPLAERIVKALENPQETDLGSLKSLAESLVALTVKLDATAAAPLAERMVKALENPQEADSKRLFRLASSLVVLTVKLDAIAAAPLLQKGAERMVKALENPQETDSDSLESLAESLAALTEKLGSTQQRSALLQKASVALISKWSGSQKSTPDASLLIHLCEWGRSFTDDASFQSVIEYALQQIQSSDIPQLENEDGPVIEPREREIVRHACLALTIPQLANLLKAPFCRGELQKLVLLALEQKTDRHFDGDLWKFVEAAATECYAGVDLDGPVKRIRLEEVIAEVSKHVPIPEAKPKASSKQL